MVLGKKLAFFILRWAENPVTMFYDHNDEIVLPLLFYHAEL